MAALVGRRCVAFLNIQPTRERIDMETMELATNDTPRRAGLLTELEFLAQLTRYWYVKTTAMTSSQSWAWAQMGGKPTGCIRAGAGP
eukprot:9906904-Lingulodinium_polyedra.AAC.1